MYSEIRTNKFNAKRSQYDGYWYDSKMEAGYAMDLDWRIKGKDIKSWERQIRVSLDIKKGGETYHICDYIVDFKIHHNDGSIEWIEVKGMETREYQMKKKLFEALILTEKPDEKYTVVKSGPSYRTRSGKWFNKRDNVIHVEDQ